MLFLYIFLANFVSAFTLQWLFKVAENYIVISKILLWIQWRYLPISILLIDSQGGQVEGLFSLPKMLFFRD